MRAPEEALGALLSYVGVDASTTTIARIVGQLSEEVPELSEHQTTESPQRSIGRWRTDLEPDLREACDRAFGDALALFGYEAT